jgi:hypothetical protein
MANPLVTTFVSFAALILDISYLCHVNKMGSQDPLVCSCALYNKREECAKCQEYLHQSSKHTLQTLSYHNGH